MKGAVVCVVDLELRADRVKHNLQQLQTGVRTLSTISCSGDISGLEDGAVTHRGKFRIKDNLWRLDIKLRTRATSWILRYMLPWGQPSLGEVNWILSMKDEVHGLGSKFYLRMFDLSVGTYVVSG